MQHRKPTMKPTSPIIVGIGASAGGLEAFQDFLTGLGDTADMAIVFVQHLDPSSKSQLSQLLATTTTLCIVDIGGRTKLKPGTLYICPPQALLDFKNGFIAITSDGQCHAHTIDHFLYSLAEDQGENAVGIILSGSGSDGTLGLKAISDQGGLTFAQDAKSAKYDSMPRSAATTGVADHVLEPKQIAAELTKYIRHLREFGETKTQTLMQSEIEEAIPEIADTLMRTTNHNFGHYKVNTLRRRIQRRMQILKIVSVAQYVSHLQDSEDEAQALFRELLIGVTAFFRDPQAFTSLRDNVLPKLFEHRTTGDTARIWVAGCANGAEAFTMAMLCREVMDEIELPCDVQIFATDIDERAIQIARTGTYPSGIEDHVSPERLKRFFVKRGKRYQVAKEIREMVLFSVHNLISDPPFSRQDLISCRNLLIYLGSHLQNKLIPLFHYALRPGGHLFLGPSENITSHGDLFRALDAKHRISQRKGTALGTTPSIHFRKNSVVPLASGERQPDTSTDLTAMRQRILLDEFSPKSCIIDENMQVLDAAANLEKYLSISDGIFHNNIIKMAASGLKIGLRAAITEAKKVTRRVTHENLSVRVGDKIQQLMITVQPMPRLGEDEPLYMIVFHDVGLPMDRSEIIDRDGNQEVRVERAGGDSLTSTATAESLIIQLERELETTKSDLDKSMQDMEAANEELKSSNEELLSMNEELQSANEELETSKEEIRAVSDAVARANDDLQNLLQSTRIATVFLDQELNIRSFTPAITDLYSLIPTDAGRPLEKFVPNVREMPPLPTCTELNSGKPIEHTILADSGKSYIRRVLPYHSHTGDSEGVVVTFSDVTELTHTRKRFQSLVEASAQIVWVTDSAGEGVDDSPSWRAFTGQTYEQWIGRGWIDAVHPDDRQNTLAKWEEAVNSRQMFEIEYRLRHHAGGYRWTQVRAVPEYAVDGSLESWVGMNTDITERKNAEEALKDAKRRLDLTLEVSEVAPWNWDAATKEIVSSPMLNRLFCFAEDSHPKIADFLAALAKCDRDRVVAALERTINDGEDYDIDYQVILPKGETRHLRAVGKSQFSDSGEFVDFIGVAIDITERKRRELDTAEREAHLRRVINNQLGLVGVIDREGILLEVDDRSLEIAKTPREDVIGKHFADAPWWSYDPAVVQQMRDAMRRAYSGEVVRYDVSLFAHGGEGVMIDFMIAPVFDEDGTVEFLVPSGVDIRDRKAAELECERIARRMQMAMRAGGMAAWEWTPEESFWSPELFDLMGLDRGQTASPELFFSNVHLDDLDALKHHWQAAVDGNDEYHSEFRIRLPNGEIRWIAGAGEAERDSAGRIIRIHGVNWDATLDRKQEEALRESERRANEANRSKSAFVANMSHEIRTPMTAILGYADLIRDYVEHPDAVSYLRTIRRNGDYLLEIINDILDLSKIEAGKLEIEQERFEPIRVVEDVRSVMEVRATEGDLRLEVEYDGKIPKVIESDAKRLKQILINLVGNAIKFTKQGSIKIRVKFDPGRESPTDHTEQDWVEASPRLLFDVIDTGIGISDDQLDRLFKPFSQGDATITRNFGGTGLGLAISQRLAEMLGGRISASSTQGVGSTFTVSIAVNVVTHVVEFAENLRHPSTVIESAASPKTPHSLNCHVLVVDDRRDIRFLSRSLLTKAGATVDECEDGMLAVEHITDCLARKICPDLILLDMQMPNLDGYQTAKKLRGLGYNGPIIALTADAMQGDMNECLEAGCNDYLSKPIDSERLIGLVNRFTKVP